MCRHVPKVPYGSYTPGIPQQSFPPTTMKLWNDLDSNWSIKSAFLNMKYYLSEKPPNYIGF